MGLFTRGKVWLSQDRDTYLEFDKGTGLVTLYVQGVAVFTASNAALTFLAETGAGETITGTITAANVHVQTAFRAAGTVDIAGATTQSGQLDVLNTARLMGRTLLGSLTTQSGQIDILTTARLMGNTHLGATTASLVGLYGNTPIGQPAATAQGAVGTGAASGGLMITATTTNGMAGFQSLNQVTALLTNFNNLVSQVDATGGLVHAIRTALVQLGAIRGVNV